MPALRPDALAGRAVSGWRVREGQVFLRLERGEEPLLCECGRAHFLLTEELALHRLLLRCHGCGKVLELPLG